MMTTIGVWVAATLTLAIYSFLYKDNPFYKVAEHIYVGMSAAYWLIQVYEYTIKPMLWNPITSDFAANWILLIPAILGIMMLSRWFPSIAWISRWPIAFTVGIGAGLGITGIIQGWLIPQIQNTLLPFKGFDAASINNLLIVIGVVTTLAYFYFSKPHKGALGWASKIGITYIMIAFGASFGYTVMARISLLIGRVYFLFYNWLHIIK